MNFLEKDLETIIYEADRDVLESIGLSIYGKLFRQLRIGNYGISDLISVTKLHDEYLNKPYLDITVYEIKRDFVDQNTFFQALKYAKGIQKYLSNRKFSRYTLNIVLIGKSFDIKHPSFIFIPDLFETWPAPRYKLINSVEFKKYTYEIDGLKFSDVSGYCLSNSGFNNEPLKVKF